MCFRVLPTSICPRFDVPSRRQYVSGLEELTAEDTIYVAVIASPRKLSGQVDQSAVGHEIVEIVCPSMVDAFKYIEGVVPLHIFLQMRASPLKYNL